MDGTEDGVVLVDEVDEGPELEEVVLQGGGGEQEQGLAFDEVLDPGGSSGGAECTVSTTELALEATLVLTAPPLSAPSTACTLLGAGSLAATVACTALAAAATGSRINARIGGASQNSSASSSSTAGTITPGRSHSGQLPGMMRLPGSR